MDASALVCPLVGIMLVMLGCAFVIAAALDNIASAIRERNRK